jgi:hypothetical protein
MKLKMQGAWSNGKEQCQKIKIHTWLKKTCVYEITMLSTLILIMFSVQYVLGDWMWPTDESLMSLKDRPQCDRDECNVLLAKLMRHNTSIIYKRNLSVVDAKQATVELDMNVWMKFYQFHGNRFTYSVSCNWKTTCPEVIAQEYTQYTKYMIITRA